MFYHYLIRPRGTTLHDAAFPAPTAHPRRPAQGQLLVLYINDSTDDQVLFQAAARKAGVLIDFHVAESVERGISYLKSLLDLSQRHEPRWVDLVLLDLVLLNGSGLEVLKYIRETPKLRALPVAILTGQINPDTHKKAFDLGVNAFHEKPVSFQDSVQLARLLYDHWSCAMRPTS